MSAMDDFLLSACAFVLLMVAVSLVVVLREPGSVARMMAGMLFCTGGIASLLLLGTIHGMEIVINVVLTLAVLAPFATIAFVRAGSVLLRDESAADAASHAEAGKP
ncbi:monovalent cation/H+ antiporter complex subunit F [Variovorax ureilyticus]|uniref:monovalent cation/H+ antiporter complex subunit F n=1 Tax=Variovorax ureilyticus TaxID=1836198 RepID=UPI003D67427C